MLEVCHVKENKYSQKQLKPITAMYTIYMALGAQALSKNN